MKRLMTRLLSQKAVRAWVCVWKCECVDYSVVFFYFAMMQYDVQAKQNVLSTLKASIHGASTCMQVSASLHNYNIITT